MPGLLLITDDPERSASLIATLNANGWRTRLAQNGATACLHTLEEPAFLVLLALDGETESTRAAAQIRALGRPGNSAPILSLQAGVRAGFDPDPSVVDGIVCGSADDQELVRTLENWRPLPLESTRRIATMFGAGPIAGMIERLARRLEAAMIALDKATIDKAEAHRLAELCGTLGFGQAHAAWLDLSLGAESEFGEVRRTTRLTLAAIAQGL